MCRCTVFSPVWHPRGRCRQENFAILKIDNKWRCFRVPAFCCRENLWSLMKIYGHVAVHQWTPFKCQMRSEHRIRTSGAFCESTKWVFASEFRGDEECATRFPPPSLVLVTMNESKSKKWIWDICLRFRWQNLNWKIIQIDERLFCGRPVDSSWSSSQFVRRNNGWASIDRFTMIQSTEDIYRCCCS